MAFDKIAIAVQEVFKELDQHIERTTSKTGMKCIKFCSACCRKTDIEASAIEFIPLAIWLYKTGKVDEFLHRLDQSDETGFCALFSPEAQKDGNWGCLNYEKRGLICRLFGFGYRLNREGTPEVVTCKLLKKSCPDGVALARQAGVETPDEVPLFRNYSMQLYSIDPDLARIQLPINQAIRFAIEKLYFQYAPGLEHEEDD